MDFPEFLCFLNFPADLDRQFKSVELENDSCSWPLLSAMENHSGKQENFFNQSLITALEDKLSLSFEAGMPINGSVCFANTEEVRPDFRTNFSAAELLNYIFSLLPATDPNVGCIFLPFPKDQDHFWHQVRLGQKKRNEAGKK